MAADPPSHELIKAAAYGPEDLKLICEAFDRAWEAIMPVVDDAPLAQEAARLKLANMILSIARSDKRGHARCGQAAQPNSNEPAGSP